MTLKVKDMKLSGCPKKTSKASNCLNLRDNSGKYDGLESAAARDKIADDFGKLKIEYRLRDWTVSRQRYWGCPIPIIYCDKDGIVPVPEADLPVLLPDNVEFKLTGQSPLKNLPEFVNVNCPKCGGPAKRETDTFDTFIDSSWYFLRFPDPQNNKAPFTKESTDYWMPVDNYIGGAEHAVVHLLYARFWTKALHDHDLLSVNEPFKALRNQGMIGGPDGRKMGKRYGNVVTPNELIEQGYGADALRLYELFIGPYDQGVDWNPRGIAGTYRFLDRVWTLIFEFLDSKPASQSHNSELEVQIIRVIHNAVKKVSQDVETLSFNTAVASLMECINELYKIKSKHNFELAHQAWEESLIVLVQLLAPFAPHITEELWQELGQSGSVHVSKWPVWDEAILSSEMLTLAVQINGKVRAEIVVAADITGDEAIESAKKEPRIAKLIAGKKIRKTIYVPERLVSLVID
jgi:leucyl-tRNA synthetase